MISKCYKKQKSSLKTNSWICTERVTCEGSEDIAFEPTAEGEGFCWLPKPVLHPLWECKCHLSVWLVVLHLALLNWSPSQMFMCFVYKLLNVLSKWVKTEMCCFGLFIKLKIIKRFRKGESNSSIAPIYSIKWTTVNDIKRDVDIIKSYVVIVI